MNLRLKLRRQLAVIIAYEKRFRDGAETTPAADNFSDRTFCKRIQNPQIAHRW